MLLFLSLVSFVGLLSSRILYYQFWWNIDVQSSDRLFARNVKDEKLESLWRQYEAGEVTTSKLLRACAQMLHRRVNRTRYYLYCENWGL